ncbi:potassium voltage-gated channel protein [Chloropicon roscoffensis]|uniref:Potassium voltage-gated channel protein n=1 Tax=Chloropicon roscoffensis TaxID=1461544 RepID=A0AAX4PF66_9CHLO
MAAVTALSQGISSHASIANKSDNKSDAQKGMMKSASVNLSRMTSKARKKFIPNFTLSRLSMKRVTPFPGTDPPDKEKEAKTLLEELNDDERPPEAKLKVLGMTLTNISTESSWKTRWDLVIIVLVLYNSFFIPYNFSFVTEANPTMDMFDYFVDFLFLIDMALSFFTGFYDIRGDEVVDLKEIRKKYMSRWFWIDMVAIFPFEVLIIASGKNLNVSVFNLFKAPRLLRLGKLAKKLDEFAGANGFRIFKLLLVFTLFAHWVACVWFFVGRFQDEGNLWSGSVWLAENHLCQTVKGPGAYVDDAYISVPADEVGTAYMVEGVLACIKGGDYGTTEHRSWEVGTQMYLSNSTKCPNTALPEFPFYCNGGISHVKPPASVFTQYITSFYWALSTLTTIGYGDVTPSTNSERSFVVVIMLFGAILYASIFGNVAVLIQNFDALHAAYTDKINKLNEFSSFYLIRPEIQEKLLIYTDKQHRVSSHPQIRVFFQDFPSSLRGDVALTIHEDVLKKMQIRIPFTQKPENMAFVRNLFTRLHPTVFIKGDVILSKLEVSKQLYLVSRGCVSLTIFVQNDPLSIKEDGDDKKDGEIKHILESGEVFGEFKAIFGGRLMIEARAVTGCEVLALDHYDFKEMASDYKREIKEFRDHMQNRFFYLSTGNSRPGTPKTADSKEITGQSGPSSTSDGGPKVDDAKLVQNITQLERKLQYVEDRMMSALDTFEQYLNKHEMKSVFKGKDNGV